MARVAVWLLVTVAICDAFHAFRPPPDLSIRRASTTRLLAKKKAAKTKAKTKAGSSSGGFGAAKSAAPAAPTAAELLKRSMAAYEQIETSRRRRASDEAADIGDDDDSSEDGEAAEELEYTSSVTKYCVTLRSTSGSTEFADWVPMAILAFQCGNGQKQEDLVPSAIGTLCREVLEAGSQTFPSLRKVGRETIEYSFEPLDEFEKHVYDGLVGRGERRSDALKTLGLESGASAADVKRAHRKLMMELHPDSFIGDEEGAEAAKERMLEVQSAYGELGGGQGAGSGSFYESIGGKARVSFSGPLGKSALGPLGKSRPEQEAEFEAGGWRAGIYPMEPTVTREFVTRNTMRARVA